MFSSPHFSCREQEVGRQGAWPSEWQEVSSANGRRLTTLNGCSGRTMWSWWLFDRGLQVQRDFWVRQGPFQEQVLLQAKRVVALDAVWGVGSWGMLACWMLPYVGSPLSIHVGRYGGFPSKTTHTDRTIFFIIKIHYEEQTWMYTEACNGTCQKCTVLYIKVHCHNRLTVHFSSRTVDFPCFYLIFKSGRNAMGMQPYTNRKGCNGNATVQEQS